MANIIIQPNTTIDVITASPGGGVVNLVPVSNKTSEWDISDVAFENKSFDVSAEDTTPRSVVFKPDGVKSYMLGPTLGRVYQYALTIPWDSNTGSYEGLFGDVSAQDSDPRAIRFKSDGTKIFMLGGTTNKIYQYTLVTPWLISTISYDGVSFDISGETTDPQGMFFSLDGCGLYVVDNVGDRIVQYAVPTPWNLATAVYNNKNFDVSAQDATPVDVFFQPTGGKMFILGEVNNTLYQYTLAIPWDIESSTYDGVSFDVTNEETLAKSVSFKPDGLKFYILGTNTDTVYQYIIPAPTSTYSTLVLADGPIGYWRLGETSGGTAIDEVGANNGTYTNGPTLGAPGLLVGDLDKAVSLSQPTSEFINILDNNIFSFTNGSNDLPFSLEAWAEPSTIASINPIMSKTEKTVSGGSNNEWAFWINTDGTLTCALYSGLTGNQHRWTTDAAHISIATIYHLFSTYSGSLNSGKIYVNNVSVPVTYSNFGSYTGMPNTTADVELGVMFLNNSSFSEAFSGTLDEAAIYDKIVSAGQVSSHYNGGI